MGFTGKTWTRDRLTRILNGEGVDVARGVRYVLAIAVFGIALAARFAMLPVDGGFGFITFFPAVALSALICGTGPGLLTVVLSAVATDYFFMPPFGSLTLRPAGIAPLVIFMSSAGIICFLTHQMSRHALELRKYKEIIDSTDDAIVAKTLGGIITSWNHGAEVLFGYRADEAIGHSMNMLIPADRAAEEANILALIAKGGRVEHFETVRRHKDGHLIDISTSISTIKSADGTPIGASKIARDITAHKRLESEMRIAAVVFDTQEGMMVTDANQVILRVNRAFTEMTGYTPAEVLGQTPRILNSGRHDASFFAAMWESIRRTGVWQGEIWDRRKNGEVFPKWMTITAVTSDDGVVTNYVSSQFDITERKATEDEIKHFAFYDPLTLLPNRRLLLDRLNHALVNKARSHRQGALLFVDLDKFKHLNDTLGHDQGDLLLQQVAQRLLACVREGDTVARLGGDEFIVMLEDLGPEINDAQAQVETIGNKIHGTLNQPYALSRQDYQSTPSIGATLFGDRQQSAEEILKQADLAMYQAKSAGRNAVRFFDPGTKSATATSPPP